MKDDDRAAAEVIGQQVRGSCHSLSITDVLLLLALSVCSLCMCNRSTRCAGACIRVA